jgi:hypothetical protein
MLSPLMSLLIIFPVPVEYLRNVVGQASALDKVIDYFTHHGAASDFVS